MGDGEQKRELQPVWALILTLGFSSVWAGAGFPRMAAHLCSVASQEKKLS